MVELETIRLILEIRGDADAYKQSSVAVEFYEFIKSLEAYESVLQRDTALVLATESELFKY